MIGVQKLRRIIVYLPFTTIESPSIRNIIQDLSIRTFFYVRIYLVRNYIALHTQNSDTLMYNYYATQCTVQICMYMHTHFYPIYYIV